MDPEARFRRLFADAYPSLRRYALNRGLQGADADDLVAEVLTIAWRRLDDVPTDDPLPWLFGVASNVNRNRRRGTRRLAGMLANLAAAPAEEAPDRQYGAGDIRRALESLSGADQELLRLVAWDGLTPEQAARVIGCSPGTFRVRLHRARARLAAALGRDVTIEVERTVTGDNQERPNGPARTR